MNSNDVKGAGGGAEDDVKKNIAIFTYNQRLLSIDLKTTHVESE